MPPDAHMPEPAPVLAWRPEWAREPLLGVVRQQQEEIEMLRSQLDEHRLAAVFRGCMIGDKGKANA